MNTELRRSERLKLWVMPPCWGLPNASPFVLKLQTWLRMADLPHETCVLKGPPKSKTRKVPYLEMPDGELISESSVIIAMLEERHDVMLDVWLSDEQRAQSVLLQRLFEDHLYWAAVIARWKLDENWPETREAYFKDTLPAAIYWFVPTFVRRQVLRDAWGQGFGRMPVEQVWARAEEDFVALSTVLGDREFFIGQPSSIDATAFAWFANILYTPDNPVKTAMQRHRNLIEYTDRMRDLYWSDWQWER